MRVLLIEDDQILGGLVRRRLTAENRVVDWAHRLDDARAGCRDFSYDLLARFHVRCDLQIQKMRCFSYGKSNAYFLFRPSDGFFRRVHRDFNL